MNCEAMSVISVFCLKFNVEFTRQAVNFSIESDSNIAFDYFGCIHNLVSLLPICFSVTLCDENDL